MLHPPLRSGVLILLPPSEGKTAPDSGDPIDLDSLTFGSLTRTRKNVLSELVRVCKADAAGAARMLDLGPTQHDLVRQNTGLRRAPTAPAISVYTGVLYDALGASTLSATQRRRLASRVAIASALFGLVRPDDLIPAYRLSGDTSLPTLGPVASAWRAPIGAELAAQTGVIFDLRSGAYVGLGPIPAVCAPRSVFGRILLERNGSRSIVSHHNKATKGRIVRSLIEAAAQPNSVNDLFDALTTLGYHVELHEPKKPGQPAVVDVVVREI